MGAQFQLRLDVFANGKQIQPEGPHREAPERFQAISRLYKLDVPPSETSLTLVVRRIYIPFGPGAYTSFFSNHKLRLGTPDDLDRSLEIWSVHSLFERLPRLINNILLTVLALFLLALFFTQKGHVEYLWLALYELLQAPIGFVELAGSSARLDNLVYIAIFTQLLVDFGLPLFRVPCRLPLPAQALVHPFAALHSTCSGLRCARRPAGRP